MWSDNCLSLDIVIWYYSLILVNLIKYDIDNMISVISLEGTESLSQVKEMILSCLEVKEWQDMVDIFSTESQR